jgi:uncharacterized membrane protein HdeD (DUF308 family)
MKEWLKWLLLGLLSVVFGIYILGNAVFASAAIASVIGILLLVSGGFQIVAGFTAEGTGSKLFGVILGILTAYIGVSFLHNPFAGMVSLTMLVLVMFAAAGFLRVIFAFNLKETMFFWPMLITGAVSILLAGYLFSNFASVSTVLLGTLLGIEMLFNGFGLIVLGLASRTDERV